MALRRFSARVVVTLSLVTCAQDLRGFLELVRKWAPYGMGEVLAARLDQHLDVSAPL
jgi:hypothetical protein